MRYKFFGGIRKDKVPLKSLLQKKYKHREHRKTQRK